MKLFLLIPFFIFLTKISSAAQFKENSYNGKEDLMKVDTEFSNLSKEKGTNYSFLQYLADDGVMLRRNSYPIVGKDKISHDLLSDDDKNLTLTWAPLYADIAESGEIGYTYGLWEMHIKKEDGTEDTRKGTYVTIWKKDKAGNWKFVLDTGKSGLE